jgi:hypothetical protein
MTATESSKVSKAASFLGKAATLIPVVGQIAGALLKSAGQLYNVYHCSLAKVELNRIRDVAPTVTEFDRIAVRIAVEMTLKHRRTLLLLKQTKTPQDAKYYASIFVGQSINVDAWARSAKFRGKDGLSAMIKAYVADKDTQAKILGRADAQKALCHLQGDSMADNLCYDDFDEERAAHPELKYRTRHSFVAASIVKGLK